jgi:hypothetical protein
MTDNKTGFGRMAFVAAALALPLAFPAAAFAADKVVRLPFEDVLKDGAGQLDGTIKFYLAGQKAPKVAESKGEFVSNKKANAFAKGDDQTCRRAALSALLSLQERAHQVGANAVVNIVSYYKKVDVASSTDYECHVGALMSGVAFKGTMAKVAAR